MAETTGGERGGKVTMTASGGSKSWASILGKSLAPSLDKNVLEVIVEEASVSVIQNAQTYSGN